MNKGDYQDIGDAVGMPDETDRKNVRKIIDDFEKQYPGEISLHLKWAKERLL